MKHIDIIVSGKVQEVFFRKFTREKADNLGIMGIVRNEFDGTVFIEAEGDEKQLKELVEWCHQGSPKAEVKEVKVSDGAMENYTDFRLTYC